jgi:hypothetical protein
MTLNASTVTVTVNSIAKILNRIRDDGFSAEYLLREATGEFRLKVRHSEYTDKTRAKVVNRHNLELVQVVYPTGGALVNTIRKAYLVFEQDFGDTDSSAMDVDEALIDFTTDTVISDLQAWMS